MTTYSINDVIQSLGLIPHPEGGYYKESYRSSGKIKQTSLDSSFSGERNYSTCIYFLIGSGEFSAFHRIKQDEIWHFYSGSPIRLHMISKTGIHTLHLIGPDFLNGESPQFVVPGGNWFAAEVVQEDHYSLVGCTVSPGFDYEDFELIQREDLIDLFPEHKEIIRKLTRH